MEYLFIVIRVVCVNIIHVACLEKSLCPYSNIFIPLLIKTFPFQSEAFSLATSAAQSRAVTPAPPKERESWVKRKTVTNNPSDVDYKKLALVNDDLLKVKRAVWKVS